MHRPAALLLPALAIGALALTACAAAPVAAPAAAAPPTAPPSVAATTEAPPTTEAPTPTPTAKPTAADGTDLAACKDGSCDVLVTGPTSIPVPRRTGFLSFTVVRAGSGLGIEWTTPGRGGGSATGSANGHIAEGTDFEFTDLGDGTAIVRIHPG